MKAHKLKNPFWNTIADSLKAVFHNFIKLLL